MSLHELTACIYYKLAIDRGLRGCEPDEEHNNHLTHTVELKSQYKLQLKQQQTQQQQQTPQHPSPPELIPQPAPLVVDYSDDRSIRRDLENAIRCEIAVDWCYCLI